MSSNYFGTVTMPQHHTAGSIQNSDQNLTGWVGKVRFRPSTVEEAADFIIENALEDSAGIRVGFLNAYTVALAEKNKEYALALNRPRSVNFPDGTPIVWMLKRARMSSAVTRGPSTFLRTLEKSQNSQLRHFFMGSNNDTLAALKANLLRELPELRIVGTYAPPFGPVSEAFVEDCKEAADWENVDVLWLGLGTPKQDLIGAQLAEQLHLTCVGVGAAFDFAAGTVKEAPEWLRGTGFEWLYRLGSEPRRLWRRYLIGNSRFMLIALTQRFRAIRED